jgi:hypothetical protein
MSAEALKRLKGWEGRQTVDPVTLLMIPAFVGGLLVALLLALVHHRSSRLKEPLPRGDDAPLVDPINIAHVRVAGIGGVGFVLLALAIAAAIPSIGVSLAMGAALGIVFAVALILRRRRSGPLPSSSQRPGANTTLSIDMSESASDDRTKDSVNLAPTSLCVSLR